MRKLKKEITVLPHTLDTYECVKKRLEEGVKRTCYIAATGVGKFYLALLIMRDNPDKDILFVTSAKANAKKSKEKADAHFEDTSNITFEIYCNLFNYVEQTYDIIILDEFHRAGAPIWNDYVLTLFENNQNAIKIGTSATPIRYLDDNRDMAEELFDGNIAREINLRDAILMGILPMPEHYICGYKYEEMISSAEQSLQKRKLSSKKKEIAQEILNKLKRKVQKAKSVKDFFHKHLKIRNGHYIIFCKDMAHMAEIEVLLPLWFEDTELTVYSIYSNNEDDNEQVLNVFEQDNSNKLHILLCIDMLNEGVHLENITGVIMLRPTESINIYLQQIGRAFSASAKVAPKIYDLVDNAAILRPMRSFWSELENDYKNLQQEGTDDKEYVFDIEDKELDLFNVLDKFYDVIKMSWEDWFEYAKAYYEEHGNLLVPASYSIDGDNLGNWIQIQRINYNQGKLSAEKVELLESIGMIWKMRKKGEWQTYYKYAKNYYEEHGNLLVPASYSIDGYNLGAWIQIQRINYNQGKLSAEKVELLESIGMMWKMRKKGTWQTYYKHAKTYYEEHGNLLVINNYYVNDYNLGRWISKQRTKYDQRKLPMDKVSLLENIGMVWNLQEAQWHENYECAKSYYETNGNLLVPGKCTIDGYNLGSWIATQRQSYSQGKLPADKISLLESIGMVWDALEEKWQTNYKYAKIYYEEYGNLLVPVSYFVDDYNLGKWIFRQRQSHKKGNLPADKVALLESIGMVWNVKNKAVK